VFADVRLRRAGRLDELGDVLVAVAQLFQDAHAQRFAEDAETAGHERDRFGRKLRVTLGHFHV
jgi:hypothetical protein